MAASYPGSLHTFTPVVDGVDWVLGSHMNEAHEEVIAVQTELGTDVAGSLTDLKTRLAVVLNTNGTLKTLSQIVRVEGASARIQLDETDSADVADYWQ